MQALFDAAWKHIVKQGCSCAYRGAENTRCAFAPTIQHYHPSMAGNDADILLTYWGHKLYKKYRLDGLEGNDKTEYCEFALEIQSCHDSFAVSGRMGSDEEFVEGFLGKMIEVAQRFDLKLPSR